MEHPFRNWLLAGLAGTAALGRFEWLERLALGREPAYAPAAISGRLFGTRRYGPLLRWIYGPALGVAYGALAARSAGRSARWRPARPLSFGLAVAAAELIGLPWIGATPRLRGREVAALVVHACAFSLATDAALDQAERSASRSASAV